MKLATLFSGGKDSLFAAYIASKTEEIICLITVISENKESFMFHTPNINLTGTLAKAINIPLVTIKTRGNKEAELKDLKKAIQKAKKKFNIDGIVTGALASTYQSARIQKICNELNLHCFNPLWQKNQEELLKDLIKNKFEVIITQVAAEGFSEEWLGTELNKKTLEQLKLLWEKYKISLTGEGGEYESLVLNSPMHKKKIKILSSKKIMQSSYSGYLKIERVELI